MKSQVPVIALVAIAACALAVGALSGGQDRRAGPVRSLRRGAALGAFAIFFPAVTGVMAGLGLSGDLRDPGRAIPFGSLAAVLVGLLVYLAVPVLLVMGASPEELRSDSLVWSKIAPLGPSLILPGLWGAIFSSALGSMLGAPRTLQALARDRIVPRLFGGRPTAGGGCCPDWRCPWPSPLGAVMLGNLDAVAPVVTMFFLTIYGTVNIVAAFEALSGDPSWRPKVKVPWPVSLLGALACLAVMLQINAMVGSVGPRHRAGPVGAAVAEGALGPLGRRPPRALRVPDPVVAGAAQGPPHDPAELAAPPAGLRRARVPPGPGPVRRWFGQGRGLVTVCELLEGSLLEDDIDILAGEAAMQQRSWTARTSWCFRRSTWWTRSWPASST